MSANEDEHIKQLLRQAVPPIDEEAEPACDLWPAVLGRLDDGATRDTAAGLRWAWFDGALLAGLVIMGVSFPATIPLLLYYL